MKDIEEIKKKKKQKIKEDVSEGKTNHEIKIEVLSSPTCPHCPRAVDIANEIAEEYQKVEAEKLSITEQKGKQKAAKHGIMGTPTVLINDQVHSVGVPDPNALEKEIKSMT